MGGGTTKMQRNHVFAAFITCTCFCKSKHSFIPNNLYASMSTVLFVNWFWLFALSTKRLLERIENNDASKSVASQDKLKTEIQFNRQKFTCFSTVLTFLLCHLIFCWQPDVLRFLVADVTSMPNTKSKMLLNKKMFCWLQCCSFNCLSARRATRRQSRELALLLWQSCWTTIASSVAHSPLIKNCLIILLRDTKPKNASNRNDKNNGEKDNWRCQWAKVVN